MFSLIFNLQIAPEPQFYRELGAECLDRCQAEKVKRYLLKRLEHLGLQGLYGGQRTPQYYLLEPYMRKSAVIYSNRIPFFHRPVVVTKREVRDIIRSTRARNG
jgi:hypothetical protein